MIKMPKQPEQSQRATPWWWKRGIMRDITIVLLVKLAAIILIKFLFFGEPASQMPAWSEGSIDTPHNSKRDAV